MNVLDATYQVLNEAQRPLHYTEITRLILSTSQSSSLIRKVGTHISPSRLDQRAVSTSIIKRALIDRLYEKGFCSWSERRSIGGI